VRRHAGRRPVGTGGDRRAGVREERHTAGAASKVLGPCAASGRGTLGRAAASGRHAWALTPRTALRERGARGRDVASRHRFNSAYPGLTGFILRFCNYSALSGE
jgi:hypothetical protein